jgi:hypothetical protein
MSLRGAPVEQPVTLPDGRQVVVRLAVPDDPYIQRRELDTVALELLWDGAVEATVNTVLGPDQVTEARQLAREIAARLESGDLEPTAAALEPLADTIPP